MANKQATLKDKQSNNIIPNTTTAAVADVAKSQALSATLVNTPDKDTLGYESFSTAETYAIGSIVYYQNKLYKFKQLHSAGAWNASHVDPYSVSDIDERVKDADELLGSETLATEAQTVTGAINELNENIEANAQSIEGLEETKANRDGYYSQMTVGGAENLVGGNEMSRVLTHDTAGGSADIATGIARVERVKGNSLVWNQLANPTDRTVAGLTFSVDEEKVITINGTVTASYSNIPSSFLGFSNIPEHKYILHMHTIRNADNVSFTFGLLNRTGKKWFEGGFYYDNTTSQSALATTVGIEGLTVGEVFNNVKVVVQTIDLTQMFGAGNEPSTVAEFERLFPLDYYDYNEGELVSFNGTAIKSVGFNQLVGEPINVKADSFPAFSDRLYTRLIAGKEYQLTHKPLSVTKWRKSYKIYSLDGTLLTTYPLTFTEGSGIYYSIGAGYYVENADNTNTSSKFSSNKDCYIYVGYGGGTVTEDTKMEDTCIHLSHSGYRDGEYEPYWTDERELPVSKINTDGTITESAVGKTRLFPDGICSAGNIYDEITPTKAIKRIGRVDLGTLNWQRVGSADFYTFDNTTLDYRRRTSYLTNAICINYAVKARHKVDILNKECSLRNDGRMFIRDDSYSTPAAFKTAMSGVYLYYELATPIEVTFAEPLNLDYQVNDFGTEQMLPENTSVPTTAPLSMDVVYGLNVVDFVRNAPKNYISKESMTNFLTALGTAMGGTWSMEWNDTTEKYDFEFAATPEPDAEPQA